MNKLLKIKLYNTVIIIAFVLLSISITRSIVRIYASSSTEKSICVPIIMYHQVKNNNLGKDVISPTEFKSDLDYLSENSYTTITMTQLINYVYNNEELPQNPIILSFDDGYLNTYKYVYPLLKEYNMKIVLSILGKDIDNYSKVFDDNINYAYVTWDQVREMEDSGLVEIQNHTYNLHTSKGRIGCTQKSNESLEEYKKLLVEDVNSMQEKIQLATDKLPNTFTYPYGEFSDNTNVILKELDFKATLSCKFGVNLITKDPDKLYGLKRICRSHNQSVNKMIKDGMETLRFIQD